MSVCLLSRKSTVWPAFTHSTTVPTTNTVIDHDGIIYGFLISKNDATKLALYVNDVNVAINDNYSSFGVSFGFAMVYVGDTIRSSYSGVALYVY